MAQGECEEIGRERRDLEYDRKIRGLFQLWYMCEIC